ncbi:hypothetical protein DZJ_28890 [Dickeya ananatis]
MRQSFFDKAVFSTLVNTLRNEGYVSDTGEAVLEHVQAIYAILGELLTPEVKLTIESASLAQESSEGEPAVSLAEKEKEKEDIE